MGNRIVGCISTDSLSKPHKNQPRDYLAEYFSRKRLSSQDYPRGG